MRKRAILALVMVFALLATTGCSLIVKDEAVDRATPIIEVAGKTITKGEVLDEAEYVMDQYEYMYSMYGLSYDRTSSTALESARQEAIDAYIRTAVIEKKVADGGFDVFTDEEKAEIETAAKNTYDMYASYLKSVEFADSELTGEELDKAVDAKMVEYNYGTLEDYVKDETASRASDKLRADAVKDVTVSDEEVAEKYAANVETDRVNYGENPDSYDYGSAVTNGTTVYYTPAGYRHVKQILLKMPEGNDNAITEKENELSAKNTELAAAQADLSELGEDASADDEAAAAERAELTASIETLTKEAADLQAALDAAMEAGYAALQPKVDEINAKLAEGVTFEELITEYNEDPGMTADHEGYLVSANSRNWVTEFRDGAMALANVGDVSQPVRSDFGLHILKYASDVPEGEIGLDKVSETIRAELLTEKQTTVYNETVDQWVTEANAKVNKDALK